MTAVTSIYLVKLIYNIQYTIIKTPHISVIYNQVNKLLVSPLPHNPWWILGFVTNKGIVKLT